MGLLLARLTRILEPSASSKEEMGRMSCQIQEYEFLVEKLKVWPFIKAHP